MHDLTAIGILWAAVLTVVFVLPDVLVSTKYQLAGLVNGLLWLGGNIRAAVVCPCHARRAVSDRCPAIHGILSR